MVPNDSFLGVVESSRLTLKAKYFSRQDNDWAKKFDPQVLLIFPLFPEMSTIFLILIHTDIHTLAVNGSQ